MLRRRWHVGRTCHQVALFLSGAIMMQLVHWMLMYAALEHEVSRSPTLDFQAPYLPLKGHLTLEGHTNSTMARTQQITKDNSPQCAQMPRPLPAEIPPTDTWHTLWEKQLYAYSAFVDPRGTKSLKILGVAASPIQGTAGKVVCHVWYPDQSSPEVVQAKVSGISEGGGYRYGALWMTCPLSDSAHVPPPWAVSLSDSRCGRPLAVLPIHNIQQDATPEHKFVVCVCGPVKFNYSDVHQLVEWIETNSLYGAEKFVLYNHSTSGSLLPYVQYYQQEGRLDFLPWPLPLGRSDIKNFGHMSLLNDCLYRYMYRARHIAFLDLDELLVPKEKDTWKAVLEQNNCLDRGSANFRNVFFKLEWPDDEHTSTNQTIAKLQLKALLKTKRESKIWPFKSRSKYIARPEYLLEAGVHFPHKYQAGPSNCNIPPEQAWVQHYRWWDDPKPNWLEDASMLKYADRVINAAKRVHLKVHPHYFD